MSVRRIIGLVALVVFAIAGAILLGWITLEGGNSVATVVALVSGVMLLGVGFVEAQAVLRSWQVPEPEDPPRSDRVIMPTLLDDDDERVEKVDKAVQSVEQAEDFVEQTKRRVTIDVEEIPED